MDYRLIEVNERWYVAFYEPMYRDYVIEFGFVFSSRESASLAVETGKVLPLETETEK